MKRLHILTIATGILLAAQQAESGGILLYETGTPEVGLADAGSAARAQDAATVATNPAGMTRLDGDELLVGAQALYGVADFTPNSFTTTTGGNGDNPIGLFPGASLYYSHSHNDRLKYGLAFYGNFGLALDYGDDWAGRYQFRNGALLGMALAPTVAYKLTDNLSVGGGLNMMYGYFSTEVAVNNPAPGLADGKLEVSDSQLGIGGNFGLMYEFSRASRIGLQYTTEISLDFSDTPDFSGLGPGLTAALGAKGLLNTELGLDMTVPQTAMFSFFHQVDDTWALLGNLGWQDWSEYGKVGVEVQSEDTNSLTKDRDYDDSYHAALGTQIDIDGPWLLSGGIAYDSGIDDDLTRTPDLPNGDTWRFSVGGQYAIKENMLLGLGYTFLWMGDLDMDQQGGPLTGRLAGTYENANIQFFALNLKISF
ncbi:MAG: outer membrane protein transport protein [Thermodesulfobacteriota bacterium]|nr:outer membrane protein transport protein [Thermodesulfobacteriota bacterium]